jgi:hypothetical protein
LSSSALRARASLATIGKKAYLSLVYLNCLDITGPKYAEGMYLFYPEDLNKDSDFDIIFVHGVTG